MLDIQYSEILSFQNNNNIIFFISKIKELNNFNLPIDIDFNIKNKTFHKKLEKNKKILINTFNKNTNFKLLFVIIEPKSSNVLNIGSSINDVFDYKIDKNINFQFSSYIIKKYSLIIPQIVLGFQIKHYAFRKYLSDKSYLPNTININCNSKKIKNKIYYNQNLLFAINTTKDLVSEPANILNPVTYAERCKNLKIDGLKIKVLNFNELKKIGMNSLLSVSQGSSHEPKVVIFEWNLIKNVKPTILVGKGVTFDSGGISLKSAPGMAEMITDMGGSAVVVGSMINIALNKINKSVVGIIGLVENMPDAKAQRPGDIVKSLSGQTIEVLNTDAEGRLVLADLITYIQDKYKPLQIIDFATLTGAIMIALGTHKAGLFSNNNKLSNNLSLSGEKVNEPLWRLPMGKEYSMEINSPRADMRNIGSSRYGGSIHAAEFIKRFVKNDIPWAHIDIAGVSWTMKGGKNNITDLHNPGATAFGVRLIDNFLKG